MEQINFEPINVVKSINQNGLKVSNEGLTELDSVMQEFNITSFNQILAGLINGNLNLTAKEKEDLFSELSEILQKSDDLTSDLLNWFDELSSAEQLVVFQMLTVSTNVKDSQFGIQGKIQNDSHSNQVITNILANLDLKNKPHVNQKEIQKLLPLLESHSDEIKTFLEFAQKELLKKNIIQTNQVEGIKSYKDTSILIDNRTINLQNIFTIKNFDTLKEVNSTDYLKQDFEIKNVDLNQLQLNFNNIIVDNRIDNKMNNTNLNLQNLFVDENFINEFGKVIIKNLKLPNGESETKIQLQPSELGKVDVKLSANNGHMTAQIITETVMGKELLESQIHQLKQSLTLLGYQIEKIEVQQSTPASSTNNQYSSGGFGFSEQQPSQQQQRDHGLNYSNNYLDEEEEMTKNYLYSASGIDYTA